jgi:hypothetical protein
MKDDRPQRHDVGLVLLSTFVFVALILISLTAYTKYIFAKDYNFYIEAPCDPTLMTCFVRDCDDYCPPNGLSTYRAYMVSASVFPDCIDNSCTNICLSGTTSSLCEEIICSTEDGDSCSDTKG